MNIITLYFVAHDSLYIQVRKFFIVRVVPWPFPMALRELLQGLSNTAPAPGSIVNIV